jgi:H/ACA ribonucleoprotein complex subunit 4
MLPKRNRTEAKELNPIIFQEADPDKIASLSKFTKDAANNNDTRIIKLKENDEVSDKRYGNIPIERPLQEYLKYGFVALDKPQGPTSHEVVAWVRKMFHTEKAGHSGTLDPMVSGVLPVGLGSATKALSAFLLGPKEYLSVARIHDSVPNSQISSVLSEFLGTIYQKPPQRSSVRRATRTREIYETELIEQDGNLLLVRTLCEAGTYIRKLIYDYGEILKVGATMAELRRTRVCDIFETDLVRLHDLYEAQAISEESGNESKIREFIMPIEHALGFLKQVKIRDSAVDSICHGAQLAVPGVVSFSEGLRKNELVRVLSGKGELVAVGETQMDAGEITAASHGVVTLTKRVIMEAGTYPKMWKKSDKPKETEEVSEALIKRSVLDKLAEEDNEISVE